MFVMPAVAVGGYTGARLFSAFTLIPLTGNAGVLPVAWTLFYEILFYALFACLILNKRFGAILFAAWVAIILFQVPMIDELKFIIEPLNLLFLIGIAVVEIDRRTTLPMPLLLGWVSTALFLVLAVSGIQDHFQALFLGLAAGGAILGFVQAESWGQVSVPKPLVVLGAASYSIYLVHAPLLSILAKILGALHVARFLPAPLVFILYVGCALGGGVVFYYLIERPLLLRLQKGNRRVREIVDAAPLETAPMTSE